MTTPAGWYPNPENPNTSQRYWDGTTWSTHTAPSQTPTAQQPHREPLTTQRFENLTKVARQAKIALLVGIFLGTIIFGSLAAIIQIGIAAESAPITETNPIENPALLIGLIITILVAALAYLVVFLYYQLMWQYKASEFSRDLGVPAKFSPALGTFSWLIPYVSYVLPFMAMLDLLPARHEGRKNIIRWWIAFGVTGGISLIFPIFMFYPLSSILIFGLLFIAFVTQEIFGRQSITAITEFQTEAYFRLLGDVKNPDDQTNQAGTT